MSEKKILIVEDEDDSRFLMAKKLRANGYQVVEAANGKVALALAKQELPDLIITDVLMPEMDGNQLIKELRQLHSCKSIPIIVITVRTNMKDYFETISDVSAFLAKPFPPEALLERVTEVLTASKKEAVDAPKRILIAGAHLEHVETIVALLRQEDYHVDYVSASDQIISKAVLFLPNIFIFEIQMCGIQVPYEVVKILRQMPQFRRVPILFYSVCEGGSKKKSAASYQEEVNAIALANRCLEEGGNEYLGNFDKNTFLECTAKYLKKGTILVVDDDKGMLFLVKSKLEEQGYKVLTALSGMEGLRLIKKAKPDLVMLDIIMPDIDGYEVLGMMKQDPAMEDIPVLMLTVRGKDNEIQKALDLGAKDYIVKPFYIELLLKRIENHLEKV